MWYIENNIVNNCRKHLNSKKNWIVFFDDKKQKNHKKCAQNSIRQNRERFEFTMTIIAKQIQSHEFDDLWVFEQRDFIKKKTNKVEFELIDICILTILQFSNLNEQIMISKINSTISLTIYVR